MLIKCAGDGTEQIHVMAGSSLEQNFVHQTGSQDINIKKILLLLLYPCTYLHTRMYFNKNTGIYLNIWGRITETS